MLASNTVMITDYLILAFGVQSAEVEDQSRETTGSVCSAVEMIAP
uniref:Uncharacterized protein n=1 Tax=Onchocerca volvulus TaxID=6282 RepID=A0A8R1XUL6_ONCVO